MHLESGFRVAPLLGTMIVDPEDERNSSAAYRVGNSAQ
jgi:hypothetical protein